MVDAAECEQEDTGVHHRRRDSLYARAEGLLERAARLGSEHPPPPSDPPTSDDLPFAETLDLEPDPESHRASMH